MRPPAGAARLLAAAIILVHRRPGAPFGLLPGDAALLIALGDMVGLALLLVGIFTFIASGHLLLLAGRLR